MFTNVNVNNHFGIKLTTTSLSTAKECATADKLQVNWQPVDIEFYEQHKVDSEKAMHPTICCPEILNTTVDVYKAFSSSLCYKEVIILSSTKIVHCNNWNSRMKPTSCPHAFETTVKLENIRLSLPLEVLGKFMEVDIIETYSQSIDTIYPM